MKICLPINTRPPVVGYVRHAYRLALLTTDPRNTPWIQCHYLALTSGMLHRDPTEAEGFNFHFTPMYDYDAPGLERDRIHRDLVCPSGSPVVPFLVEALARRTYPHMYVDEFHLPHKRAFEQVHFSHQTLVIGCDLSEDLRAGVILTLGFDAVQNFGVVAVPVEYFEHAFQSHEFEAWKPVHRIDLFRLTPDPHYVSDSRWVRDQTRDYLQGHSPEDRSPVHQNPVPARYGVDTYEGLAAHLHHLIQSEIFDLRPLHLLWEHKTRMAERIAYMIDRGWAEAGQRKSGDWWKPTTAWSEKRRGSE